MIEFTSLVFGLIYIVGLIFLGALTIGLFIAMLVLIFEAIFG